MEERFLRPVWSRALGELMTAGRLFIVGYSFPESDQFFKYMLGLALETNNQLSEIHVVNPSAEVAEKFQRFFNPHFHQRAVRYLATATNQFVSRIQDYTRQEFDATSLNGRFTRG